MSEFPSASPEQVPFGQEFGQEFDYPEAGATGTGTVGTTSAGGSDELH